MIRGGSMMSDTLTILTGPMGKGEQFALSGAGPIGIGKFQSHRIRLMTPKVSRNHAALFRRADGGWRIEDCHSTNGVFVNGQRVTATDVHDGDILRIGEFVLRFDGAKEAEAIETLEEIAPRATDDEDVAQLMDEDEALPPIGAHVADAGIESVAQNDDDLYELVEPEPPAAPRATPAHPLQKSPASAPLTFGQTTNGSRTCMSCGQTLPPGAKVCVACGIDLVTGKHLVTARDIENDVAIRADTWIRIVSWIIPLGLFPIASEAFATKKAYATWVIFALTFVCSAAFFIYLKASDDPSPEALNLMHWTGSRDASLTQNSPLAQTLADHLRRAAQRKSGHRDLTSEEEKQIQSQARAMAADMEGAPEGVEFHWYQLFTCALLHGGILHIAGNMLFLLVFGLRVNELVGSPKFAFIYPFLAGASSWIDHLAHVGDPLQASLGASGAIMGLAGMYLVFFPVQRVHMAMWIRVRIFWMAYKIFTMRGFWLLVCWIALNDLLPMAFGLNDHVAHWAHLGGFAVGMALAIALLLSRQADAYGVDLISMLFGKRKPKPAPAAVAAKA